MFAHLKREQNAIDMPVVPCFARSSQTTSLSDLLATTVVESSPVAGELATLQPFLFHIAKTHFLHVVAACLFSLRSSLRNLRRSRCLQTTQKHRHLACISGLNVKCRSPMYQLVLLFVQNEFDPSLESYYSLTLSNNNPRLAATALYSQPRWRAQ